MQWLQEAIERLGRHEKVVLVTVASTKGSAPREAGAKMLVAAGDIVGTIGGGTLIRFYVLHCVAIPFVAAFLIAVHFWRVRRDGGISGPV